MNEEYLTSTQVGKLLGVGKITLGNWRKDGIGPPWVRMGRRLIRYKDSELRKWIDENQITEAQEG